jgi:hypothetical protein
MVKMLVNKLNHIINGPIKRYSSLPPLPKSNFTPDKYLVSINFKLTYAINNINAFGNKIIYKMNVLM